MRSRLLVLFSVGFVCAFVVAPATAQPSPNSIVGVATLTAPDCDPDENVMPLVGVNDSGPVWTFVRPTSVGLHCEGVLAGLPLAFIDNWDPDTGGCLMHLDDPDIELCIDAVPSLGPSTVDVELCFDFDCWQGSGTFVRVAT
jgi:hypothetical protein